MLSTNNSSSGISGNGDPFAASTANLGPRSPGAEGRTTNDFLTGYTIGLIGGVRSWVSALVSQYRVSCSTAFSRLTVSR